MSQAQCQSLLHNSIQDLGAVECLVHASYPGAATIDFCLFINSVQAICESRSNNVLYTKNCYSGIKQILKKRKAVQKRNNFLINSLAINKQNFFVILSFLFLGITSDLWSMENEKNQDNKSAFFRAVFNNEPWAVQVQKENAYAQQQICF